MTETPAPLTPLEHLDAQIRAEFPDDYTITREQQDGVDAYVWTVGYRDEPLARIRMTGQALGDGSAQATFNASEAFNVEIRGLKKRLADAEN